MKLLMHICCAPCAIDCLDQLKPEDIQPELYWYNPNIHPYTEYKSRRDSALAFADDSGCKLHMDDNYGLRAFIRGTAQQPDQRCGYCYAVRMDAAAAFASQKGFDCFTTSLLISPYQKHEEIIKACEKAAFLHGVKFFYKDFRPGFREGQKKARQANYYMQKYCGCIFSEEERYLKIGGKGKK